MILPEVTTLAEARDAIRDLAEEVEKLRTDWNGRYQLKRGKGYREEVTKSPIPQLIVFVEKRFELSAMRARGGNEIYHPIPYFQTNFFHFGLPELRNFNGYCPYRVSWSSVHPQTVSFTVPGGY